MRINCIRVNIISDILSTNALSTNRAFRFLMRQGFFKEIDCKSFVIWSDCGTHFRSAENSHFFLVELPSKGYSIELNYFGEKHGKNNCDQHFSVITKYLEYESYKKRLISSDDIVKCINEHQTISNLYRVSEGLEPIIVHSIEFIPEIEQLLEQSFFKISDITCYFNFFVSKKNPSLIFSRVLTDCMQAKSISIHQKQLS